ncbi:MAG: lysophospholipid acyltransferase family protein [Muribaculaceae bacterium]|nr:lysophospholipid acyltransferase family protein [Muribaculaceae bacterium]
MKHWQYLPVQGLLYIISLMPFWVLYGIADFIFVLVYYVVRYRRKIVAKNMCESFPELSDKELSKIARKFYRNFADYIVETIKLNHISDEEIKRRMVFKNMDIIDRLFDEKRSIAAYFSHCGNWEWVPSITLWSRHTTGKDVEFCQVYRPLKNKWYDEYMLRLRSRFNSLSFKKKTVLRDLLFLRRREMPSITGFMSDQKPSKGDESHIVKFLNHPSAVITGTEQVARKLDMAVVYFDMHKLRRGYYELEVKLITDNISTMEPMAITDAYVKLLEETIKRNPSIWLWTHNRWKHKVKMPNE